MKKFFSWLTVFMLALSLAVPAGATESKTMIYGDVELPKIETANYYTSSHDALIFYNEADSGYWLILYKNTEYLSSSEYSVSIWGDVMYYNLSGDTWVFKGSTARFSGGLTYYVWGTKQFGDVQWDTTLPRDPNAICDGSSCPATDENIDGICDDCGMMLMSLSRSPVAPDVTGSNKNYVMFYSGTVYKYTVYTSDEVYTIRGEEYGARYRTYTDPSVTVQRYESHDGINWEQTYNGKTANDYPGEIGYELISSTFDWYTEAGDRFFPVPLWEEIQSVTQGEMGNLTAETAGTTKVLVVCGVGLMALLVVLSLFGKRSLLFLR